MLSKPTLLAGLCLLSGPGFFLFAQDDEEKPSRSLQSAKYAVRLSAKVRKEPARIELRWPAQPSLAYAIYRRSFGARRWKPSPAAVLNGEADRFVDEKVETGIHYEYRVDRFADGYVGRGYLCSGIEIPMVEDRGGVLLLVESSAAPALADELQRLMFDLIGDGWRVVRKDVSREESVERVRNIIGEVYRRGSPEINALMLIGHIPVPYSGSINPDGHKNHVGAWPADLVYADVDGRWTDEKDHKTFARGNQENLAADGKYDQNTIDPDSLELEVGRIDLADMPMFGLSENELLRRYLDRNHDYRHARIPTEPKGLIDDNFGAFSGEAFGWNAWANFATFFGAENTEDKDWFSTLPNTGYLWAYGCGGGSNRKAKGVGETKDFAELGSKGVFTMLFGSYFGDWNHPDNFLRAPLAAEGNGLTCAWAGRPHWVFHPMAMGQHIGYCVLRTQANDFSGDYLFPDNTRLTVSGKNDNSEWAPNSVHVALMGDPTLRLHPVAPPSSLTATPVEDGVMLNWLAPEEIGKEPQTEISYLVYRAPSLDEPFRRIAGSALKTPRFLDRSPAGEEAFYQVKTKMLQSSASGTYFNLSQGILIQSDRRKEGD